MKIKERKDNGIRSKRVSAEFIEILENEKQKIIHFGWDALKITDAEASRVIARKYKDNGLDK